MTRSRLILGIDGGGTNTKAWLADASSPSDAPRILGKGNAGAANSLAIGFETAAGNTSTAIAEAFRDSPLDVRRVDSMVLAMAGADRRSIRALWEEWAVTTWSDKVSVVPDAAAVLAAGCNLNIGVALIAGTGSIAYGRNKENQTVRVGGWGHMLGDEGSGFWIARQALKAIVAAEDQIGPTTCLTDLLCAKLDVGSVTDLVGRVYGLEKSAWASWSSSVFEAAGKGDAGSDKILDQAAHCLADLVVHAANRLDLGTAFALALAGGIMTSRDAFRARVLRILANRGWKVAPQLVQDPVAGAVRLALNQYHD